MTFSHELQHAVQFCGRRDLWAANTLFRNLPRKSDVKLNWSDLPDEVEARIIAKRTAEGLFGPDLVTQYIDQKITEADAADDVLDASDWRFVRQLEPCTPYDLAEETRLTFTRFKQYRPQFEELLAEVECDPNFKNFDLSSFLDSEH